MVLGSALADAWKQSFNYTGKTTRIDYWLYQIATTVVLLGLGVATVISESQLLSNLLGVWCFANMFPAIAISRRRLKDINKNWKWLFISLVPLIGSIWYIVLMSSASSKKEA